MNGIWIVAALFWVAAGSAGAARGPLPGTKNAADRKAWRAVLRWEESCEQHWERLEFPSAGVVIGPLHSGLRLVQISCDVFAYQETFLLYLIDHNRRVTGPLVLPVYTDGSGGKPKLVREAELLGVSSVACSKYTPCEHATYPPAAGMLAILTKGGGIGDCGFYSTFRRSGERFVPVEARAKRACDDKPPFDPRRWPKLPLP
jgi:hypothetical protein